MIVFLRGYGTSHMAGGRKGNNGDCRQEIVLIGKDMDQEALTAKLDECLLTTEEVATDKKKWHKLFPDPFPKWQMTIKGW